MVAAAFPFSPESLPLKHFINNEYVAPPAGSRTYALYNPADRSLVSDAVPIADEAVVNKAVEAAEVGARVWRKTPVKDRQRILYKFADLIDEHFEAIARLSRITNGVGKMAFSETEVKRTAEVIRFNASWADKDLGESAPQDDGFLKIVRYEPLGVTAGILPWNGPIVMAGMKLGPALATGNAIILKPSEKTPFSALALGVLAKEAGLPAGVFQVVAGDGSTGALLSRHMRIRKISFTGSVAVGKKIQQMAAESNLKRVTLELGGKSPSIVFDDANLDNAVRWLVQSITMNTGQACFASTRVYVQDGIYDKFVARYKDALEEKAKQVGHPEDPDTLMGPLADKAQYDRVTGFMERAETQKSGTLLTGGRTDPGAGYFVRPTVYTDVDPKSELVQEEIFGPVAVVGRFKTEEEALKMSNDSEFGLMAGVFTQDINRALRVASEFESGMVGINCVSLLFLNTPFGGSKQSGIGREAGLHGLRQFTEAKTVMVNMTY